MIYSQVEHLVKMANDFKLNMTWSTTLWIYLLPTHPPIYVISYLPTYYPPTHLSFICTYLPTYLPTHLLTYYLLPYPPTYLLNFNHYV